MKDIERIRLEKKKKLLEKIMQGSNKPEKLKVDVDDNSFQTEVIEKSKKVPVVVDFWAPWCQPCLILGPILEKLVKSYSGKFVLARLNVDQAPVVSQRFRIRSIPFVGMFKSGKLVDKFIGLVPEKAVEQWLKKNLGG